MFVKSAIVDNARLSRVLSEQQSKRYRIDSTCWVGIGGLVGMIITSVMLLTMYEERDKGLLLCIVLIAFAIVLVAAWLVSMQHQLRALATSQGSQGRELVHVTRLALAGEISASIIHEVTQPLSSILINVEAMELLFPNADAAVAAEIIADLKRALYRANTIVRGLRSLLSDRQLELEITDMNEVVTGVLDLLRTDIRQKNIAVHTSFKVVPSVAADPVHLQQVLLNLFVNAMEAMTDTPPASRLLEVSTQCFDKDHAEVVVSDAGPGMTQHQLKHAFEKFFTTKKTGMGLGLSLVRSIVHAHRGAIWIEPRSVGGTSFHFTIPFATPR